MPQSVTHVRDTGHPGYSETLPRQPGSAAVARRLVRTACTAWGLGRLADDGALIVSELVTNTLRHARGRSIRVMVERTDLATVRVAVSDLSRELPVSCVRNDDAEDGRGLLLVAELAADWGTDARRWGKVVWTTLS
ncbi:ATP-binding protein [Streptomyces smaragdinus]|nr:ATP-binding protein [Streptomyces smaragdinus]